MAFFHLLLLPFLLLRLRDLIHGGLLVFALSSDTDCMWKAASHVRDSIPD